MYDSDRHVVEPFAMWQQYVESTIFQKYPLTCVYDTPAKKRERILKFGPQGGIDLPPIFTIGDIPIINNWHDTEQLASAYLNTDSIEQREQAMSGEQQLDSMQQSNIDVACLFPTFATFIVNHQQLPAEVSLAYADAYNRWLHNYCQHAPNQLKAVGLISRHKPSSLLRQLEQIISYGWSSIVLRPEVIANRDLGHPDYESFWQACEFNNIAVAFHGGSCLHGSTTGNQRFSARFSLHACSHPMEAQMAFVALLESGVLERYPKLKFAFLEAGASWLPSWLWRLDNICFPEFPSLVESNIKMLPSEYFKRQCWVGIELGEPCLREVINIIGHKKLLYGTDFPHPDHLHFTTENITEQLSELSETECIDITINNGREFYELKIDEHGSSATNLSTESHHIVAASHIEMAD
ncbi:amidohydrolase family protein [Pseudoalteromonas sp. MMG013]|uniref:amidohydrolase family protein n=1 Tax=unclassified Pseudoalteromonas TaxID=194690 RepID=UPI001B364321|nr:MULTISPECIES: amidohydrolase family protein [unclassified Pseudoalteromonas]MBQ4849532.1 amidohydrolase family protein [Pseudoalteromonas sp. MMG012]MBQ4861395.1 amidohydrolase family protein [Pseudoalteromonas sp. MMG013]